MDLDQARTLANLIACVGNHLALTDAYGLLRGHWAKLQVVILTYHRVGDPNEAPWNLPLVTTRDFENQMRYLRKTYNILPLDTLVQYIQQGHCLPAKAAIITFDDGYKDNFLYAYPILNKYNISATINLITAHIGTGNLFWFDKIKFALWNTMLEEVDLDEFGEYRLRSVNERVRAASNINGKLAKKTEKEKNLAIAKIINILHVDVPTNLGKELILSWDDIMEMNRNGVTFGAHSLTHPNLTKLPVEQAKREIAKSKMDIEERLGRAITVFCYPNGDFNAEISELVEEAGFHCALTTNPRMVKHKTNLYELGRIPGGWNLNTLKLFSCGAYSDIDAVLSRMKVRIW